MQQRSESEVISKTMTLALGTKEIEIKSKRMLEARDWRKKVWASVEKMLTRDGSLASMEQLRFAILDAPMEMIEIVASYTDMTTDELLATDATEAQISMAFATIMGVAFSPFLNQQAVMQRLRAGMNFPLSGSPTN